MARRSQSARRGRIRTAWRTCFSLPGFQVSPAGSLERIFGSEFNHLIKQIELRGARVLFVADTCYGGGMVREVDRAPER